MLIEWKYTESYRLRKDEAAKDAVRFARYGMAFADPDGPIRSDVLPFELLLDEPFYQLMRQQLLAYELERSGAHGAGRVRVLHVAPSGNEAYQQSLPRPEHRALGGTVSKVWQKLLRHPDRFLSVDSHRFCDPKITSVEYHVRYGNYLVRDEASLLAWLEANPDELDAAFDYVDDVNLIEDGVEFYNIHDGVGHCLQYPFLISQAFDLSAELDESPHRFEIT